MTLSQADDSNCSVFRRFKSLGLLGALALIPIAAGCSSPAAGVRSQSLVITGSSTVAPLINEIGKQYERAYPGTRVDVQTGGSSRGIADARTGTADIGMVSRDLTDKESDLEAYPVASDGIAILVHRSNPIQKLSRQQVKQIFSKQIIRWSEVSAQPDAASSPSVANSSIANTPITVVNKAEGRSTLEVFQSFFEFNPQEIKADVIIGDNQQGIKTIAANPSAIGYVSIGAAQIEIDRGEPLKLLPMDGVAPTLANVQNSSYPLSRVLNVVTQGQPSPQAKRFIEYATSNQVNPLVTDQQLIPVASEG
ncbi:MAG: phosphate ABC transporter substrate-binding protein [Cyanobacteria bacterium P01_F01_bin.42]